MKNKLFNNPHLDRHHLNGKGVQKIYKFDNGYGASVVRLKSPLGDGYTSYTSNENEWELAVLKDDSITYKTEITSNTIGHIEEDEVEKILNKISKLK